MVKVVIVLDLYTLLLKVCSYMCIFICYFSAIEPLKDTLQGDSPKINSTKTQKRQKRKKKNRRKKRKNKLKKMNKREKGERKRDNRANKKRRDEKEKNRRKNADSER